MRLSLLSPGLAFLLPRSRGRWREVCVARHGVPKSSIGLAEGRTTLSHYASRDAQRALDATKHERHGARFAAIEGDVPGLDGCDLGFRPRGEAGRIA